MHEGYQYNSFRIYTHVRNGPFGDEDSLQVWRLHTAQTRKDVGSRNDGVGLDMELVLL